MKHLKTFEALINEEPQDIVITLPATTNWNEYQKELKAVEDGSQVMNFKVGNLPTKTAIGSKCYLCYKGNIIGWMKIVGLVKNDFDCTTTGQHWSGNFVQRSGRFNPITSIPMKGFQGFRYIKL